MKQSADVDSNPKNEALGWLREHNSDDIRATFAVRDYVKTLSNGWVRE